MMEAIDIRDRALGLVVVDMQRKFAHGPIAAPARAILPTVNGAIAAFREAGRPVVFIKMEGEGHGIPDGLEDPDGFVDGLDYRPGDLVVHKTEMNAFHGTPLGGMLRSAGCDGAVVCGLVSRWCVHATYFGAFDEDLSPYLLRGGSAGTDPEHTRMVEALCKTADLDGIRSSRGFRLPRFLISGDNPGA